MDRFNAALDALEHRIAEPVDAVQLARIAHTSAHHFRRMFSSLAGMGLAEYVRRRRMTLAAASIVDGDETVLQIADRFGYRSPDSFTRAFRSVHGITPDQARMAGATLVTQPRIVLQLVTTGMAVVKARLEHTPALKLIGRAARLPLVHEGPNERLAQFVSSIPVEETVALKARNDVAPVGVLAVCCDFDEARADGSMFTYLHGVATTGETPPDMDVIDVPASTWAVFVPDDASDAALQQLWPRIFAEWLPANDWRIAPGPEVVASRVLDDGSVERELWLPVARDA